MENQNTGDRLTMGLGILARIIGTAVAGFILLFYLGYLFEDLSSGKLIQDWSADSTRITAYVFAIVLGTILSYWRESIGGSILTIIGLVAVAVIFFTMDRQDFWISLIFGFPVLLSGVLLLICWRRSRRLKIPESAAVVGGSTLK